MDKVFPRFLPVGPIEPANYRFFLVLNHCAALGFVVHALLIPLFAALGVATMAVFNGASTLAWGSALLVNRRGRHTAALLIVFVEVAVHSALAAVTVGGESGFHYYLFLAPPILFVSRLTTPTKLLLLAIAGALLVTFDALGNLVAPTQPLSQDVTTLLNTGNVTVTFIVLAALTYYYHGVVAGAEAVLRHANEELARLAGTDPLTGLLNRRKMVEELDREAERFLRNESPFSLLLADVDDFKRVNDRFGHEAGDRLLQQLAGRFTGLVRQVDRIARWGGEEFLFLLPDTDRQGALTVAEKLRRAAESLEITCGGERLSPTLTIGVAAFDGREPVDRCIVRADDALYRGKRQGKNCVVGDAFAGEDRPRAEG